MSDTYEIKAIGKEDFVLLYGAAGFEFRIESSLTDATEFMERQERARTLFIVDEDIVDDIETVRGMEEKGFNILILKGWGESGMAGDKIRQASIKAVGMDMTKEKSDGQE